MSELDDRSKLEDGVTETDADDFSENDDGNGNGEDADQPESTRGAAPGRGESAQSAAARLRPTI